MDVDLRRGNAIENWLHESCTIFRLGIVRLGVVQLACCVLSGVLGGVLMWLNQGNAWAGMGCWMALPFSPCTIFNIISLVCAAFLFLYAAFLLDSVLVSDERPYPQYRFNLTAEPGPLIGVESGLLIVSLLEFVAATWSASLSVGLICLCCQMKGNVFTIPYETMDDGLPHGPDIVPGRSDLDLDPGGPDIVPIYTPSTPRRTAGSREQEPATLELEWDNFIEGEITDLEASTGFEPSLQPVQFDGDNYFASSAVV